MTPQRTFWIASCLALALACAALGIVGPVRISISIMRDAPEAQAAPRADLPTSTPPPPTATPSPAPTATPQPEPTLEPTQPPERHERRQPSPTPEPSATIPAPTAAPRRPNVAIEKRASQAAAAPGDSVTFTLLVRNSGDAPAADVVVSDQVPGDLEVIDLRSGKGDIALEGQTVTAYPRTLDTGEQLTYSVVTRVRNGARPGTLSNSAIITTSSEGDQPGDNVSTTTVEVLGRPAQPASAPSRLPHTADPQLGDSALATLWPLIVLAVAALVFGIAVQRGALRSQLVTVAFAERSRQAHQHGAVQPPARAELALDSAELLRRWHAGASMRMLAREVQAANPNVDAALIGLALRRIVEQSIGEQR
jgi:uncharacterized repeat protein (TIGR01451 family)